jgi:4-hydroxyphenylpyruvate dioxygenase-like putative hemolysin
VKKLPVLDRPTMFFEIIQRKSAKSFGKRLRPDPSGGHFKALFEAMAGAGEQGDVLIGSIIT